jgi:hypothetical protein
MTKAGVTATAHGIGSGPSVYRQFKNKLINPEIQVMIVSLD